MYWCIECRYQARSICHWRSHLLRDDPWKRRNVWQALPSVQAGDIVSELIEYIPQEESQTRGAKIGMLEKIEDLKKQKSNYQQSEEGKRWKSLHEKELRCNRVLKQLGEMESIQKTIAPTGPASFQEQLEEMLLFIEDDELEEEEEEEGLTMAVDTAANPEDETATPSSAINVSATPGPSMDANST